jgi:predicted DCC family thiol-disulfide oxidoreductase YuxK
MSRRPVMIFDGDCGFCRLWIERWRSATGERVDYKPYQSEAARHPEIARESFAEAVHLIEADGRVSRGAQAVLRALSYVPGAFWLKHVYRLPGFSVLAEAAYRFVAARRVVFSRLTRLLWGESPVPAPIDCTARLVVAGIGACYLIGFVSLGVQIRGLLGAEGVMPAAAMLGAAKAQLGSSRFWTLPTLGWLWASDSALIGYCWLGSLASLGMMIGVASGPCALIAWILYLSLSAVGFYFMSFQWDVLLLEAGLIACLLAPWNILPRKSSSPSSGALWLLRLLLFKLMLQSGLVKLLSGDRAWRDLTALTYHYWTQPLPTPLAWWANRLPLWAQKASCALMFAIELGAPWLILAPRRARAVGAAAIAVLMLLIAVTGNYGFFNLLTLVLCLACLDDRFFAAPARDSARAPKARAWIVGAYAALWLTISGVQSAAVVGLHAPAALQWINAAVSPVRSINQYGLFAVMTKTRDEIAIEVSVDGRDWREWPFLYKPGDLRRAPPIVAPHMPRLDWQMWFAAFDEMSNNPWFGNLMYRILQGSPAATSLLGPNPLGGATPVYARATRFEATFSTPEQRSVDGAWWQRRRKGLFCPIVSLKAPKQ